MRRVLVLILAASLLGGCSLEYQRQEDETVEEFLAFCERLDEASGGTWDLQVFFDPKTGKCTVA